MAVGYKHTSATQETVPVSAHGAAVAVHRSALKRGDKGDTHACVFEWPERGMESTRHSTWRRKNWPKKTQTLQAPCA